MQATDPQPLPNPADRPGDWIRLQQCAGVGPVTAVHLLEQFHSPHAIFAANEGALRRHVSAAVARAVLAPPTDLQLRQRDAALAWMGEPDRHFITWHDSRYPASLRQLRDAPVALYVHGNAALLQQPALAMVGSRNASTQGKANAQAFGRALSDAGLTIVSGMALGIDGGAHEGGLAGPASTVAVLGTGIDRIYPRRHESLARRIAEQGCLVSEYALGYPVKPENFPRRNRIISGLARGVLVVEAAIGSGSLITAAYAREQNREVFALPGSIHAPLSKGCNKLIQQGAKLVDSVHDILVELGMAAPPPAEPRPGVILEPAWQALLDALGEEPVEPGLLSELTARDLGQLHSHLLALELAGHVERLPGGRYQRVNRLS